MKYLVLIALLAAIAITCITLANAAPDETLLEQVGQSIGGLL